MPFRRTQPNYGTFPPCTMGSHLERSQSDGVKREQLGYIVDVNTVWGGCGATARCERVFFFLQKDDKRYRVTWLGESNPVPKFEPMPNTHVMASSTLAGQRRYSAPRGQRTAIIEVVEVEYEEVKRPRASNPTHLTDEAVYEAVSNI
jgi:hypothetical protein